MPRFYELLPGVLAADEPFALGIISSTKGSSPQKKGAKAVFFADGRILGTLGGGCLEAEVQDRARQALLTRQPCAFELILDHDFGHDDGLICGGKVSVLMLPQAASAAPVWRRLAGARERVSWGVRDDFTIDWVEPEAGGEWLYQETVLPPCVLWIAGAGHVARAVAFLAVQVDFEVVVFDDRPAQAQQSFFPAGVGFRVGPWEQLLAEPLPTQPVLGLIATRGHQHDAAVLANWIRRPFVYLGMLGSRRKARLLLTGLLEQKLATAAELDRVACPVGLDIMAESVPEIAVSIVAQAIQQRAGRVYGLAPKGFGPALTDCTGRSFAIR